MKFRFLAAAALVAAGPACATNLVTDGSFESGGFDAWFQYSNTDFTGVTGDPVFNPATDGTFQAFFGPVGSSGTIAQSIHGRVGHYTVSFDLGNDRGNGNFVYFGTTRLQANAPDSGGAWVHYKFYVTSGASPVLKFGFQNDPSYYVLDNVVVSIPEPASWALLIAGFGLTGAAMRRRKAALAA